MSGSRIPPEAPPSYSEATGSSSASTVGPSSANNASSHLNVPSATGDGKNGIPTSYRRSMEDEQRPLPTGWVRTYDPNSQHQFYVDTSKDPPRSIWVHPYDDDEYLSTLSGEERERLEQEGLDHRGKHTPSKEEMIHAHSDDEDDHQHASAAGGGSASAAGAELPPRPDGKGKQPEQRKTFGRKLKDKLTGMSHEERVEERKRQAEAEQRMYEQHLRVRQAMTRAMQTGQPQHLGKDRDGKDVYIEPPPPPTAYGGYGGYGGYNQGPFGGGGFGGGYGGRGYGYSPYGGAGGPGVYSTPNARYIRPQGPYQRGGSGMGMPLAIGGGLLGGLLLGDLLF